MPIQQHPLPQDISSYKFRLIGDMTVRQFLFIAGFILLTVLTHNSPIPFFFRYPLEIFFLGLGIGLAFVPVQGRPLDQWIVAFIKSIYSPTQYVWKDKKDLLPSTSPKAIPSTSTTSATQGKAMSTSTTTIDLTKNTTPTPTAPARPPKRAKKSNSINLTQKNIIKPSTPLEKDLKPATPLSTPTVLPNKPTSPTAKTNPSSTKAPTANLPIPFTPDQPNTIVGLTLNPEGLILDGVLIEIISAGLTIRATKSNKLGQFLFAKALENGLYQIKAEKENYNFTTYSITLTGNILKPLKIQSHK